MKADVQFWRELKAKSQKMTKQQYRTIKGQAVSGKVLDARRGITESLEGGITDDNDQRISAC